KSACRDIRRLLGCGFDRVGAFGGFGHGRYLFFFLRFLGFTGCARCVDLGASGSSLAGSSDSTMVIPRRAFRLAMRASRASAASEPGVGMFRMTMNCWAMVHVFDTTQ